ncbi:MAG: hypothetical protein AAB873_00025 [Patescibacteria group bacterium]
MEILGKILGSQARVKVMRLFLLNSKKGFARKEIIQRSRVNPSALDREIKLLASVGFIKKHNDAWFFETTFRYKAELERLLIGAESLDEKTLIDKFKKAGKLKFLLLSRNFIKNKDTRVDLLIVGDQLKRGKIEEEINKLEAEMGTELVYVVFDTKEFLYRINMYDKLVRDILDYPHKVILQAKELSTQTLRKL